MNKVELIRISTVVASVVVMAFVAEPLRADEPGCVHWGHATRSSYRTTPLAVDSRLWRNACPPIPLLGGARGKLGIASQLQIDERTAIVNTCDSTYNYSREGSVVIDLCGIQATASLKETIAAGRQGCAYCSYEVRTDPMRYQCGPNRSTNYEESTTKAVSAGVSVDWSFPAFPALKVGLSGSLGYTWGDRSTTSTQLEDATEDCQGPGLFSSCRARTQNGGPTGALGGSGTLKLGFFTVKGSVQFDHSGVVVDTESCSGEHSYSARYRAKLCINWSFGVSAQGVEANHGSNLVCPINVDATEF